MPWSSKSTYKVLASDSLCSTSFSGSDDWASWMGGLLSLGRLNFSRAAWSSIRAKVQRPPTLTKPNSPFITSVAGSTERTSPREWGGMSSMAVHSLPSTGFSMGTKPARKADCLALRSSSLLGSSMPPPFRMILLLVRIPPKKSFVGSSAPKEVMMWSGRHSAEKPSSLSRSR